MKRSIAALAASLVLAALPGAAAAGPIPGFGGSFPAFTGAPATPDPVKAPDPPRHPFMAPNGRSNLHDDAYQTDTYQGLGPLGNHVTTTSTFFAQDCASVTFDARGRIVTACVGLLNATLRMLDPHTLATLASYQLPLRDLTQGNPFTGFAGGGYFYLDEHDRAVIPTTSRHILVIGETGAAPGFHLERDYDLTQTVPLGDAIISALPDWSGRLWFATEKGIVGTVDPASGAVRSRALGEPIGNSFAVDEQGGVYIVTDKAMYRFDAGADGTPQTTWRETYANTGVKKPGQTQAGSGTTPTLMGKHLVAITDNADPMDVLVYRRGKRVRGDRLVCRRPVFAKGASDTDQSIVATPRSMVLENNYGYASPLSVELGQSTTGGLARVDLDRGGGCHTVWTSSERAPSVVPKLSLAAGLVYTYTKDPRSDLGDPWYFTALDFRTGRTVYKALTGNGLGFNNNYAPVTLGPDGTAYVGVLGGLVALRDG